MIRHGAQLVFAYGRATVPRICVILRKSYGGAYIVMDSKTMGNDLCLAWPWAELAVMGAGQAAAILQRRATPEERAAFEADYAERLLNPYVAAERGYVDAVIDPAETRREIAARARRCSTTSASASRRRKHDNTPALTSAALPTAVADGRRSPSDLPWATALARRTVHEGDEHGARHHHHHRRPHRQAVTVPITDGVFPSSALRELDPTCACYDPAFLSTAACTSRDHLPRRRRRHPALPRLPDRAAGRAVDLPRGRLPPAERRAARTTEQLDAVDLRRHPPHVHPREHAQAVHRRLPLRRPPDGDVRVGGRRARHVLPRRQGHLRHGRAATSRSCG